MSDDHIILTSDFLTNLGIFYVFILCVCMDATQINIHINDIV